MAAILQSFEFSRFQEVRHGSSLSIPQPFLTPFWANPPSNSVFLLIKMSPKNRGRG
jgi:hypothetical protein